MKMWPSGERSGSWSRDPAGTTTSSPLRVWCGRGAPQAVQNVVAKLLAVGRSYRLNVSSPEIHRKRLGST